MRKVTIIKARPIFSFMTMHPPTPICCSAETDVSAASASAEYGQNVPITVQVKKGATVFVPVVGTYLGGALPLLIALLESPGRAIAVVVYVSKFFVELMFGVKLT